MAETVVERASLAQLIARDAIKRAQTTREKKMLTVERARATRRQARGTRSRASASRAEALRHSWHLWSVGVCTEPPSFVPEDWSGPPSLDDAIATAIEACTETRERTEGVISRRPPETPPKVIGALALAGAAAATVQARLTEGAVREANAIGACVAVIDRQEDAFSAAGCDPEVLLAVSAARRSVRAGRLMLALSYASKPET